MFTSRAEYRLLLRHDNADRRLTRLARQVGSVGDADWARFERKEQGIAQLFTELRTTRHAGDSLERWLRRTDIDWPSLCELHPPLREWDARPDVVEQVALEVKYAGYIGRQAEQVERFQKMENRPIPAAFDYAAIPQLRVEAREKLSRVRPANIGQAGRVSGITPADLAVLLLYLG
jgi:tRNA uridine 5-carboxymethylaminomethyl modification enzyme